MTKRYIGIDPGMKGGIGVLDEKGELVSCHDMPTIINGFKRAIDVKGLDNILRSAVVHYTRRESPVALEHVHSMPRDGVVGAFSFGDTFGSIRTVLVLAGFTVQYVPPKEWKKYFKLSADKQLSIDLACKLFSTHKGLFYGPKGGLKDGRAEACLIARYAFELNK